MRNWPLRWKIALYSAWLAVAATLGGAITTWFVMRHAEIAAFDRRLTTDAQEFFRDVEHFEDGRTNGGPVFKEILVPLSLRKHLVEVTDASGAVLYLSPRLRQPFPRDGIKEFHNHEIDGKNVRLAEFSENGLTLRAGDDLKEINQIGRDIFLAMLGAIPTVLLITLFGSAWVASKAIAPVEEIRQAAKRITAQRLDQRLPVPPTNDEIAGLIEVLNATFERLQRSFEQSARFSADASHHLKTPIAVLRAGVEEIIADDKCSESTQARAEGLLHRIHHVSSVVDNLLLLSRADAGRLELSKTEFDLGEVLEGVLDDALTLAEPLDLKVEADVPKHLLLKADRTFVAIIAQNLVENAVKYNTAAGRIRVEARLVNGVVEMTVGNTGDGIPKDRTGQLFERFYRVRGGERVAGHGLGLSTARELARAHGGDVVLVRSDDSWTEMRVHLPRGV
jgi:two-component system, OmpR family, heavy metal sensor histidine kinase CusS